MRIASPRPPVAPERLIASQPWETLVPHLLRAGASVESAMEQLRRFALLLLEWNRGASNLISRSDERRIVERHLSESIEPAHWLRECGAKRWLDLGSGGGVPAIPLILAGVESSWILVESRRNKTLFLRKVVAELQLQNVQVEVDRLENLVGQDQHRAAYDGFTSRAVMTLGPTLKLASHFVAPGGRAFLWKGGRREDELRADSSWKESWELDGLLGIGIGLSAVMKFVRK